jgi:hypothetical protein
MVGAGLTLHSAQFWPFRDTVSRGKPSHPANTLSQNLNYFSRERNDPTQKNCHLSSEIPRRTLRFFTHSNRQAVRNSEQKVKLGNSFPSFFPNRDAFYLLGAPRHICDLSSKFCLLSSCWTCSYFLHTAQATLVNKKQCRISRATTATAEG